MILENENANIQNLPLKNSFLMQQKISFKSKIRVRDRGGILL